MSDTLIKCHEYFNQGVNFKAFKDGTRLATDIDCFLEYNNKLFIFIEFKHENNPELPLGQKLALERLGDAITQAGGVSFVLLVKHSTNSKELIDPCKGQVIQYRYKWKWIKPKKFCTPLMFVEKIKNKYLK